MKFGELYFHTVAIAVGASFLSSVALGASVNGDVQDIYKTVTKRLPHNTEVCHVVQVPVTRSQKGSDDLGSFIIGGLIGSAVGNHISKDNGAGTAGAIIGGAIANERQKERGQDIVVGYREEQRCTTQTSYTYTSEEVYSHSVITFTENGRTYNVRFTR